MTPIELAGTTVSAVAGLLAVAIAVIVLRAGWHRRVNQRLAAVLATETVLCVFVALMFQSYSDLAWAGFFLAIFVLPWTYLRFLGHALATPLTRPLRAPFSDGFTLAVPAVVVLLWLVSIAGIEPDAIWFVFVPLVAVIALVPLFALIASFDAWRRAAPRSVQRTRAASYLLAFAVRDLSILVMWSFGAGTDLIYGEWEGNVLAPQPPAWLQAMQEGSPLIGIVGILAYVPLLAYGVLKTQLFDIDLKIKAGLKNSTLMGFFVVAFFVAEQIGQSIISERAGPYVGLAGAGLLAIAISPLRRLAKRIADGAMPNTEASDAYIAARKLQVYRAALEGAYEDGDVTPKERSVLTHLAAELGLHPREMALLEEEVARRERPDQRDPPETPA